VIAHKDAAQTARYRTYRDYAEGRQGTRFSSAAAMSSFGARFAAFKYNRCAGVVDAFADRMRVAGFGARDDATAQKALDLWDGERMDGRQGELWREMFTTGDAYLSIEKHPDTGDVHFWVGQADHWRVRYSRQEPGNVILASKTWIPSAPDPAAGRLRLNIYHEDRIEKYVTRQQSHTGTAMTAKAFEQWTEEGEAWPMPLEITDTVPVFHFGNNAWTGAYGESELRDVIDLQDAINTTITQKLTAQEFVALAQRVIIGVDTGMEGDSGNSALERFRTGADAIMTIANPDAKISEFAGADIGALDKLAETEELRIARTSKVPVHYLTQSGGFPSGRAMRTAEAPFVSKVEDRQLAAGQTLSDAVTYGLRLDGVQNPEQLTVNWRPAAPLPEEDVWDLAIAKKAAGMPFPAILRESGYEPDQIEQITDEADQAVEAAQRRFDAGRPPVGQDEEGA
jgi:hypothetical protein